jgi:hypothetical protein
MTLSHSGLQTALRGLDQALDEPHRHGTQKLWRLAVRQRMASLRACLDHEASQDTDDWLEARSGAILRERNALLGRMSVLGPLVQHGGEVTRVREDLKRLLVDVNHHLQRLSDLAYDDVELELGGSE